MKTKISTSVALIFCIFSVGYSNSMTKSANAVERSPMMNTEIGPDTDMIEAEDYDEELNSEEVLEERMEDTNKDDSFLKSEDEVNYNMRTRTNRERKAINTSSDASDDE